MADIARPGVELEFEDAMTTAFAVIYARLASRYQDPQLAEEVTWDSLTRAYEEWRDDHHYFDERNLTEWCSQRATWRALDRLRRRSRHPSLLGDPYENDPSSRQVAALRLTTSIAEEDRQLVWDTLQKLEPAERDLLIASYYDGDSDQSIGAQWYEQGSDTARGLRIWRRRQKAQARLRDLLLEAGYETEVQDVLSSQAL